MVPFGGTLEELDRVWAYGSDHDPCVSARAAGLRVYLRARGEPAAAFAKPLSVTFRRSWRSGVVPVTGERQVAHLASKNARRILVQFSEDKCQALQVGRIILTVILGGTGWGAALRERPGGGGTGAEREPPACAGSDGDQHNPTPMGRSTARRSREGVISLHSALVRPHTDSASPP